MARHPGHRTRARPAGTGSHDLPQPFVGPAHISDLPPVARPGRPQFERIVATRGQPPGRSARDRLGIELAEAFEDNRASVGRHAGEARDLRSEAVRCDRDDRVRRVGHAARVVDAEGDHGARAAVGRDAAQLAPGPQHQRIATRHPVDQRIKAVDRPGLLHVHIEIAIDHLLLAGGEVLDPQLGLVVVAADERQPLAIGRWLRAHCAAITADRRGDFTRGKIVALDGEGALRRILRIFEDRARGDVARIIDRAAVGRVNRLAKLFLQCLAGTRDQLYAAAPRNVVEPYLAGAERALRGEMLFRHDIIAIGRPARLVEQAELFLGQLALVRPVGIHDPDIVAATAIAGERDARPVGREARLHFPGQPLGDPGWRTARDRHRVAVAQQRESQAAPVGRDVDIHPRAFVGTDWNLPDIRPARCAYVPLFLFRFGGGGIGGCRRSLHRHAAALGGTIFGRCIDFLFLDRIGAGLRVLGMRRLAGEKKRKNGGDTGLHGVLRYGKSLGQRTLARSTRCTATRRSGRSSPAASAVSTSN